MNSYFFKNSNLSYFIKKIIKLESKIKRKFFNAKFGQGLVNNNFD